MTIALEKSASHVTWSPQPEAAQSAHDLLHEACSASSRLAAFAQDLGDRTGTRLFDWVDHFKLPVDHRLVGRLGELGFQAAPSTHGDVWRHAEALVPSILVRDSAGIAVAIKVESVDDFLEANDWARTFVGSADDGRIRGAAGGQFRLARVAEEQEVELFIVERHGWPHFATIQNSPHEIAAAHRHFCAFRERRRAFAQDAKGFAHASELIRAAADEIGVDWACDRFFAAERDYWQSRNRAAQIQKARQDALGLGWANHDHHTYRSSRENFALLVRVLEELGFELRERFYAGREAGWGAQVLEQPRAGVVIFADVDLAAEEVADDFAHEPLPPRSELGTVGLWCRLHGESFLEAGMHHLECQFDYTSARAQLASQEVASMDPFTNFDYLKQCFTEGQIWPVEPSRIDALLNDRLITHEEAARFRTDGALGSHLEILERNDGYKGFNQTGINDIIRRTDPRK
jgi:hypothetical protein